MKTAVYAIPVDLKRPAPASKRPGLTAGKVTDDATQVEPAVVSGSRELPPMPSSPAASKRGGDDLPVEDADLIDDSPKAAKPAAPQFADPFADASANRSAVEGAALNATMPLSPVMASRLTNSTGVLPMPSGETVTTVQPSIAFKRRTGELEPPAGRGPLVVRIVTSVVGLALLAFGVLLYSGGGRLGPAWRTLRDGRLRAVQNGGYQDVLPLSTRSVLYPTATGNEALVILGSAKNTARENRRDIDVVAELRDRTGRVVASERAPLGLVLGPPELSRLTDRSSVSLAFRAKLSSSGQPPVRAGEIVPFTVVMLNPPLAVNELSHQVRLERGGQLQPLEPPAEEISDADRAKEKRKMKMKLKGKKGKRKARGLDADDDEEATPAP